MLVYFLHIVKLYWEVLYKRVNGVHGIVCVGMQDIMFPLYDSLVTNGFKQLLRPVLVWQSSCLDDCVRSYDLICIETTKFSLVWECLVFLWEWCCIRLHSLMWKNVLIRNGFCWFFESSNVWKTCVQNVGMSELLYHWVKGVIDCHVIFIHIIVFGLSASNTWILHSCEGDPEVNVCCIECCCSLLKVHELFIDTLNIKSSICSRCGPCNLGVSEYHWLQRVGCMLWTVDMPCQHP